jgi:hypothetical protein
MLTCLLLYAIVTGLIKNMLQLHYHTSKIDIPESWNECTMQQFLSLSKLLHQAKDPNIAALEALRIAWNKSKLTFYGYMRLWFHSKRFDDLKARAVKELAWVFNDQPATEQLLPKYRGLYGPLASFGNMQMIEFHACEISHFLYRNDKSEFHLNKLVAVLYREKNTAFNKATDEDIRVPFNDVQCQYNMQRIAKWPRTVHTRKWRRCRYTLPLWKCVRPWKK